MNHKQDYFMKTLILVRHAKSSHNFGMSSDFERPLNDRGISDAKEMGKKLFKKSVLIDQFVSSPAIRAKSTAELFVKEYDRKLKEILFIPALYHSGTENFIEVISGLDDQYDHVALFSHNPGITDFASNLTSTPIAHMPTCSVFAVTAPVSYWTEFPAAKKSFLFFYRPE
jgi:phosphohistidine phosphatase